MVISTEDMNAVYIELSTLSPADRRRWLQENAPSEMRAHWWLALIQRAEFDASPHRGLPDLEVGQGVSIAVDLVEAATETGMPRHYAAGHFLGLAAILASAEVSGIRMPEVVTPNGAVRYALESFRLSPEEALAVAARRRQALMDENAWSKPGDKIDLADARRHDDSRDLQDIENLLFKIEQVIEYVDDRPLSDAVKYWLGLRDRLDIGEEAAQFGRSLLRRWRDEQAQGEPPAVPESDSS
jgi:hypothetical protein